MALMKCKECGSSVSTTAATCPQCGAKVAGKQTTSGCAWTAVFVIALPVIAGIFLSAGQSNDRREREVAAEGARQRAAHLETTRLAALTPEQRAVEEKKQQEAFWLSLQAEARRKGLLWNYSTQEDEVGRGKIRFAIVKSLNEFELSFPYAEPQRGSLQLRAHPEYGRDVIVAIERGQIICHSFSNCKVTVRFGQAPPMKFDAAEAANNDSTLIFLKNADRFVANLRKAGEVAIEVPLYQRGPIVLKFDTTGLEWK